MYELKYSPSIDGVQTGNFDFRTLEEEAALMRFAECPKLITLATHTSLAEITPIFCNSWGTRKKTYFQVPKQKHREEYGPDGTRFIIVRVITGNGVRCWLVVCEWNRRGVLLSEYRLNMVALEKFQKLQPKRRRVLSTKNCSKKLKRARLSL